MNDSTSGRRILGVGLSCAAVLLLLQEPLFAKGKKSGRSSSRPANVPTVIRRERTIRPRPTVTPQPMSTCNPTQYDCSPEAVEEKPTQKNYLVPATIYITGLVSLLGGTVFAC